MRNKNHKSKFSKQNPTILNTKGLDKSSKGEIRKRLCTKKYPLRFARPPILVGQLHAVCLPTRGRATNIGKNV